MEGWRQGRIGSMRGDLAGKTKWKDLSIEARKKRKQLESSESRAASIGVRSK
jgi:hypothetical protein